MNLLRFPRKSRGVGVCFTDETTFHWRADRFGVITEVGSDWTQLTGQRFSDVQNMGFLKVVHPDDQERVARLWYKALSVGGRYATKFRVKLLSGEYAETSAVAETTSCDDGRLNGWLGTTTVKARPQRNVVNLGR